MSGQRTRCDGHMSPLALMSGDSSDRGHRSALHRHLRTSLPEGEDGARTSGFGRYVSARVAVAVYNLVRLRTLRAAVA